jgi:YidC/Oxa1 family membrane protein insertase
MFGLVVLYQALFASKAPAPKPPSPAPPGAIPPGGPPTTPPPVAKPVTAPAAALAQTGDAFEREVKVETPTLSVVLTTRGGGVKHWRLKKYVVAGKGPVDIIAPVPPGTSPPLAAWGYEGLPAPAPEDVNRTSLDLGQTDEDGTVVFSRKDANGLRTEKRLRFGARGYTLEAELRLRNEGKTDLPVEPKIVWGPGFHESRDKAREAAQRDPTMWVNGSRVTESPKSLKPGAIKIQEGVVDWTALQDHYFAAALIPETKGTVAFVAVADDGQPWVGLRGAAVALRPGQETVLRVKAYGGPKEIELLAAAAPHLDRLVDLGWFVFGSVSIIDYGLARPALYLLRLLASLTGNYGLAIIALTILFKAALFPLTQKSLKSMQAMQALQPKIQAIREKYKRGRPGDRQKMNEEIAELFRRHNVSGLAGCLPMLVQMPVLIGLYNALSNSIELWQAHFLWIKDLSSPEQGLFALPEGIPFLGGLEFRVLPLVMGATQFVQMKMSPTGADPAQAAMMTYVMPVFLTAIFYSFPAGLVLYWLCFNVLQIGQQYLLNKSMARAKADD